MHSDLHLDSILILSIMMQFFRNNGNKSFIKLQLNWIKLVLPLSCHFLSQFRKLLIYVILFRLIFFVWKFDSKLNFNSFNFRSPMVKAQFFLNIILIKMSASYYYNGWNLSDKFDDNFLITIMNNFEHNNSLSDFAWFENGKTQSLENNHWNV